MTDNREFFNQKPVYSLTEISQSLRSVIAKTYSRPYYIKAEIVKLNYYPHSGHCYPELAEKEDNKIKTQMRAIIWSSQFREINSRFEKITGESLKEGINILCLATIEYDVKYGLSLQIQDIEPTYTMGDMIKNKMLVIEQLKKENIFDANKEKKLTLLPKRIAIISVETSKGYGDFRVTLENNPYHFKFEYTLFPSILQGEKAVGTITARLDEIRSRVGEFDSVVIIRGGGGDVGLSCYDDYHLAAAVATFPLPVIAGIGHSTNITVTDMVAYQSKITPTDVANFFIDRFREFNEAIDEIKNKIKTNQIISEQKRFIEQIHNRIKVSSSNILYPQKEQIDHSKRLISLFLKQIFQQKKEEIKNVEHKIELLHPDNILKRGFSITCLHKKAIISQKELKQGDKIVTKFYDGEIESEVIK
jgi:exodeoxyribonuclease VII large subunit